jgi:hypothetical protein
MRLTRSILLTGLSLVAACQGGPPQGDDGTAGTEASDDGSAGTEASDTGTVGTEESDTGTTGTETEGSDDALECVTLLASPWAYMRQESSYVTPDGRVLIAGGSMDWQANEYDAWVWAFDVDGTPLWSRDFGPGFAPGFAASNIRPRGEGFAFLRTRSLASLDFVSLDADGNVDEIIVLGEDGVGYGAADWVEAASGNVLLGGSEQGDFWLGRLDGNGTIEMLVQEDYAGFPDDVVRLARYGDVIGALVNVGAFDFLVLGKEYPEIVGSTLLVEYDEQGVELRRTPLGTPDETIMDATVTWSGTTLDVGANGTWLVSGHTWDVNSPTSNQYRWVAAVRDGDILWRYEESLLVKSRVVQTTTMTDDILLAGYAPDYYLSDRLWALRLDSGTGEVLADVVGPAWPTDKGQDGSQFTGSGVTMDGRVRLVGMTNHEDVSQEQWLCTFVN